MPEEQKLTPVQQLELAKKLVVKLLNEMENADKPQNFGGIGLGLLGLETSIARLEDEAGSANPEQMY